MKILFYNLKQGINLIFQLFFFAGFFQIEKGKAIELDGKLRVKPQN